MSKYIKINEELNIKCNKLIKEYLNPDYIYIPYDKNSTLNIKDNEEVYKNSIILVNKDKFTYSPVSGKVLGMCDNIVDNKKMSTIVIENNFKESTRESIGSKRNISNISKEDLIERLKKYALFNYNFNGKYLVINGIDYEPYEETYSYLISSATDKILECIDALVNILKLDRAYFAIRNNDKDNVITLVNQIGIYPNIELKLLPDIYPIGYKSLLINELNLKEDECIYLTVEDVYNIYNVLKKNVPITEKLVTITGNLLNKRKVVNVKIGTRLSDIIQDEFKILNDDYHIIVNGLLSGIEVPNLNVIITSNVRSVFINSYDKSRKIKCINCGLCHVNCPFKCDPRTGYNMDKCTKCGLCNYICPSKIKLVGEKHE